MNPSYLIPQGRVDMGSNSISMMNKAPLHEISGQFSGKKCSYEFLRQPHCGIVEMSLPFLKSFSKENGHLSLLDSIFSSSVFIHYILVSYIPIFQSYLLFINNVNYHASELIMQPGKSISNLLSLFNF